MEASKTDGRIRKKKNSKSFSQVKMDDEDMIDVLFWLNKTSAERIAEVTRLRKNYYTHG